MNKLKCIISILLSIFISFFAIIPCQIFGDDDIDIDGIIDIKSNLDIKNNVKVNDDKSIIDGFNVNAEGVLKKEETFGEYKYDILYGKAVITGYTGSSANVTIPSTLDGYEVSEIGERAFYNCKFLKSVIIPNGVISIGNEAFYECNKLSDVQMPDSITNIGEEVFYGCNLNEVVLPSGIKRIEYGAFYDCHSLVNIVIPNGVTDIGDRAFYECKRLKAIPIPNSVITIGEEAFYGCGFDEIDLPDSVTSIGNGAFYDCYFLKHVILPNSLTTIKEYSFAFCESLESVIIPEGVTSIGEGAFYWSGVHNVTIPNSVNRIGDLAFSACSSLISVSFGNGVTNIGEEAFSYSRLMEITIPNNVTNIGNGAFSDCYELNIVKISNGVINIGENAFCGCSFESISIPSSVVNIGEGAFSRNYKFKNIAVDENNENYKVIDNILFDINESILLQYAPKKEDKEYIVPSTVAKIGNGAFASCKDITNITIPTSVTRIGDFAFFDCNALKNISVPSSVTNIGENVLMYCPDYLVIIVEKNSYAEKYCKNNDTNFRYYNGKPVNLIKLNKNFAKIVIGKSFKLSGTVYPKSNFTNRYLKWKSLNKKVATVDAKGKVVAKNIGKAFITASATDGSNVNAKAVITVVPARVIGLKVKAGKKQATVSFNKAKGAKKYEIYRSTKRKNGFKKVKTTSSRKWTNKKLKSKKTYYYKVRAINGKYKGAFSNVRQVRVR